MIARYYGRHVGVQRLRELAETTRQGSSLTGLADAAEAIGLKTLSGKLTFLQLVEEAPLPCIAYWNQNHFIVVYQIKKHAVFVADPAHGFIKYDKDEFITQWTGGRDTQEASGIVLLLEPEPGFAEQEDAEPEQDYSFSFVFSHLARYKKFIFQLLLGVVASSIIGLIFPFIMAAIVDVGIKNQDLAFVYLMLAAQIFLFTGRIGIEVLRGWILLHLSARLNITLLSDFFLRLMKMPIAMFDAKVTGDILQRIKDHGKVETFLTSATLNTIFSLFNLVIFSCILAWYALPLFALFILGSGLYVGWIFLFLKKRERLNYKMFSRLAQEQDKVIELILGMQEIKLNNAERQKRWSWEHLQARVFKIQLKGLSLEQTQSVGANLINEGKNILITFFAVTLVLEGEMTIGMMLAISYILGQLNYPLLELARFVHTAQDARIAFSRLAEVHLNQHFETTGQKTIQPPEGDLHLKHIHYRYTGAADSVLADINLMIPQNKVTAIVGASGSGKTTLLKLLLQFYSPTTGDILIGNQNLKHVSPATWRNACGVVMQEGYIFNDTITGNIAVGEDDVDIERLVHAVEVANLKAFIDNLPLGYKTRLGNTSGMHISGGEKQRILIARAVYKNPSFIFFDEATSALDATNERIIMDNVQKFFKNRTAIVIAHRLSTVKNADQIIVLNEGKVAEVGDHASLINAKGIYFKLIRNQLELERLS